MLIRRNSQCKAKPSTLVWIYTLDPTESEESCIHLLGRTNAAPRLRGAAKWMEWPPWWFGARLGTDLMVELQMPPLLFLLRKPSTPKGLAIAARQAFPLMPVSHAPFLSPRSRVLCLLFFFER